MSAAIPDDEQAEEQPEARSRYDEMADGYARFWAPVLRDAAERVLDHLAPHLDGRARRGAAGRRDGDGHARDRGAGALAAASA